MLSILSDVETGSGEDIQDRLEIKLTAKALLLISVELGDEKSALKKLKSTQNVKEAYLTYGVYDIIAIVEAETQDKLKETITYQIRALPSVKTTLTLPIVE
jgi:DNA-binding Lrp family transcriptional regulator